MHGLLSPEYIVDGEIVKCGIYEVAAGRGIPGFDDRMYGTVFRDWHVSAIDLRPYIGKVVTVELFVNECTRAGHWAYAYLDCNLTNASIFLKNFCHKESFMILEAPEGFQNYRWSNGASGRIVEIPFQIDDIQCVATTYSSTGESCEVNFTFKPYKPDVETVRFTLCEGEEVNYNGEVFIPTTSKVLHFYIKRQDQCDSLVNLDFNVHPKSVTDVTFEICENEPLVFEGVTYKDSGLFEVHLISQFGCDSLILLRVSVSDLPKTNISKTICEGYSYSINGDTFSVEGEYSVFIKREGQCDSLVNLNLLVVKQPYTQQLIKICQGEIYVVGSDTLYQPGIFETAFPRVSLCDSIVIIELKVFQNAKELQPKLITHELGDSLTLSVPENLSPDLYNISWLDDHENKLSKEQSFSLFPLNNTIFTLLLNENTNCEAKIPYSINLKQCEIRFPTAISPNGDSINDYFSGYLGKCVEKVKEFHLYNRWGNRILSASNVPWEEFSLDLSKFNQDKYLYYIELILINNTYINLTKSLTILK